MGYDVDTTNWPAGTRYFTQITDHNHSGWLYIITLLSFIYVIITFIIRFVVKYGKLQCRKGIVGVSKELTLCRYVWP